MRELYSISALSVVYVKYNGNGTQRTTILMHVFPQLQLDT